jgi:hypothetical protein
MRLYSLDEEQRVRDSATVQEWTRSGLLDASQRPKLDADIRVDLRRTNVFLRAGLMLFTALIIAASVALVFVGFELKGELATAVTTALAAAVCLGLAEYLVRTYRFYRFGVEETLAVGAVALLMVSGFEVTTAAYGSIGPAPAVVCLAVGAAGGFALYLRFGFIYAAIGSMGCLAAIPFALDWSSPAAERSLSAAALAVMFALARIKRLRHGNECPGDEYGVMQAVALCGVYLVLNLTLSGSVWLPGGVGRVSGGAFYWFTFVMTWSLPAVGLGLSLRGKDRPLLAVSIVMSLATLLTNKSYLGWPRHPWDPILLGVFLMGLALVVRRWLLSGPEGERNGFTPLRVLSKDRAAVAMLGMASATFKPVAPATAAPPPEFGGGRSGGGGASGSF